MSPRLKAITAGIIFIVVYWIILWWMQPTPKAYHAPPLTPKEIAAIQEAIQRHGDYPIIGEVDGIWMIRNGKRIRVL